MPLCQLDGVLHLSPEKPTNNEPFWHQKNHWISGELVRVLFQRGRAVPVVQIVESGAKWRATTPVILLQIVMLSPQGLILWKVMSPCPEPLTPILATSPWVFCNHTDSAKWCKMKGHYPSDFVTNSYVESSGTHLVKSHEFLSRAIDSHFNNESLGLL